MKIYEIEQAVLDCIDAETGEILDIERLEALRMEYSAKIDNIACWYKQLTAEAEAIKNEKDALNERQRRKENQAERLKNYLSEVLDGRKTETARNKISWRKSESVEIVDEKKIPSEFIEITEILKPRKDDIKKALKNGILVQGARLYEKNNIQVNYPA